MYSFMRWKCSKKAWDTLIKILTIVGARPQFIKASALSLAIREKYSQRITEEILHTGQHFDENMSSVFFEELHVPKASYSLKLSSSTHAQMTGQMLPMIAEVIDTSSPDLVLVYGDTNSTLAGGLAAVKLGVPVAHVEAGMRSRNFRMPEEINRVLVDRISALNFAPSNSAMLNLDSENLGETSTNVGDIAADVVRRFEPKASISAALSAQINDQSLGGEYVVATIHRQESTDNQEALRNLVQGLNLIAQDTPVVIPVHPRLASRLEEFGLDGTFSAGVVRVTPVGFLDMLALVRGASVVVTDSGGLQKEAFYLKVPCVTLRSETEWVETIDLGWNRLSENKPASMLQAFRSAKGSTGELKNPYGKGHASEKILDEVLQEKWRNFFL
jgi:UDP-GlcNAc3NAcA epimerase